MKRFKLASFLDRYDAVLFDMDGVVTSEQMYWNSAALAVFEMYFGSHYYGSETLNAAVLSEHMGSIRRRILCCDQTIRTVKNRGVNSNWDLAYVVLGAALYLEISGDFKAVLAYLADFEGDVFSLYNAVAENLSVKFQKTKDYYARLGPFWQEVKNCFQEWFLGDRLCQKSGFSQPVLCGKPGLLHSEEPLVDKEKLICLLRLLHSSNKHLGVGTGRPRLECESVLSAWGVSQYFAPGCLITYDSVTEAEQELASYGICAELTKPHPFMFIKGMFGNTISALDIFQGHYDAGLLRRALVVGDAGADLFAAKAAGFGFAAVLTGVQGQGARSFFEKEQADFILNDVLELMTETQ